jgi:hypothetical protein
MREQKRKTMMTTFKSREKRIFGKAKGECTLSPPGERE